jgi:hypothetical protein
MKMEVGYALL